MHLDAMDLNVSIIERNTVSRKYKFKITIFLSWHFHIVKIEYIIVKVPLILWNNLKERHDHKEL